jgi:hypothetical protein
MAKDIIEFYDHDKAVGRIETSFRFIAGDLVSIKKITYRVRYVSFALDYPDRIQETAMRCNVELAREE